MFVFPLSSLVSFVVVGLLYTLEDNFSVVRLVGQVRLYESTEFKVVDRASLHCLKILVLINVPPIHHSTKVLLKHHIQPYAGGSSIPFHKGVGDIHFHILGYDVLKGRLRHLLNRRQRFLQVEAVGEAEVTLGDIHFPYLSGKVIETSEQILVYLLETLGRADFYLLNVSALVEAVSVGKAKFVNLHSDTSLMLATMPYA